MTTSLDKPARIVWRGSNASAQLLEDAVNEYDAVEGRAGRGQRLAKASTDYNEVRDYSGHVLAGSALVLVDTYAGRFTLGDGGALVATEDGWTTEGRTS